MGARAAFPAPRIPRPRPRSAGAEPRALRGPGPRSGLARATLGALCAGLLGFAGCSQTRIDQGARLAADPRAWITEGETTREDLLERLGAPTGMMRGAAGEIWSYVSRSRRSRSFSLRDPLVTGLVLFSYRTDSDRSEELTVFLDPAGVVREFGYRPLSEPGPRTEAAARPAPPRAATASEPSGRAPQSR